MKSAVLDNLLHFKGPYRFLTMYSTLENKIHTAEFVKNLDTVGVRCLRGVSNCDTVLVGASGLCIYALLCLEI